MQEKHQRYRKKQYLCKWKKHRIMDSLMTFAKENFQLITLFVGLLGVVVSIWAVCYEIKKKRKNKKSQKSEETTEEA